MNVILSYFLKNISRQNNLLYLKARSFVIMELSVILLVLLMIAAISITTGSVQRAANPIYSAIALAGTLLLIRTGRYHLAADILSFILFGIAAISIFKENIYTTAIIFFIQYYLFMLYIVFAALFARKAVFLIISVASIAFSIYAYQRAMPDFSPEIAEVASFGIIVYLAVLAIISVLSWVFINFVNKAMTDLDKSYMDTKKQNSLMNKMMVRMQESITRLNQESHHVNSSSQQQSEGAARQAATSEELGQAMEQMLEQIHRTNQDAVNSMGIVEKTRQDVEENLQALLDTLDLVGQISNEISVITEIANKTDLLSINASIEAARAGTSGRGFAIVAQEVRKLADKSLLVSEKIEKMSRNGVQASAQARVILERIVPDIKKSTALMQHIIMASKEQNNKAELINSSVQELQQIASDTSTSAEELAATAEELSVQAEQLKEMSMTLEQVTN